MDEGCGQERACKLEGVAKSADGRSDCGLERAAKVLDADGRGCGMSVERKVVLRGCGGGWEACGRRIGFSGRQR